GDDEPLPTCSWSEALETRANRAFQALLAGRGGLGPDLERRRTRLPSLERQTPRNRVRLSTHGLSFVASRPEKGPTIDKMSRVSRVAVLSSSFSLSRRCPSA